ncbi:hypothetical protein B0J12DRAFT_788423 [Macrophomina phaseolina]|uniref:Cytochrome P450 n=1 Tax=Macrophomina phaseolina TaxID=35725 RepID=A0ABQ8G049_9PEZI|nr:hypothetical protein B0J12DRAFT_788423 [Macrophomina phaseolina]
MAIGRAQASLAAFTNEIIFAAANINVDLTLLHIEAPREYQELGRTLSRRRRQQAESGSAHITARRLGALFQDICPQTPMLVQAYGNRVSQIAEVAERTTERSGIFADHTGIDGTSIWAAATSSIPALHMQLLAAMLARIWSPDKATAMWVELVEARRREMAGRFERGEELLYLNLMAATQAEITRDQLREWDASARSWLQTADSIKEKEQDQLMSILDDVEVPISTDRIVSTSIIGAWKSAMMSTEMLIGGTPQSNDSGPALLALSSWHLYPDVLVMGKESRAVHFTDHLVPPGGVLTIGLEKPHSVLKTGSNGLHWSLSLAHLRYYGHPVPADGRLTPNDGRLSFPGFVHVAFGCFLGYWQMEGQRKARDVARFIVSAQAAIERAACCNDESKTSKRACAFLLDSHNWWNLFANSASLWLESHVDQNGSVDRLIKLGIRRSQSFLPSDSCEQPFGFFGLGEPELFMSSLKDTEERIAYLRSFAESLACPNKTMIIRYFRDPEIPEYATAIRVSCPSRKRGAGESEPRIVRQYRRWVRNYPKEHILAEEHVEVDTSAFIEQGKKRFLFKEDIWASRTCHFMFGDPKTAAIFQEASNPSGQPSIDDLIRYLDEDRFNIKKLLKWIERGHSAQASGASETLVAISAASMIYRLLPDALISPQVFRRPISGTQWASYLPRPFTQDKKLLPPILDGHISREISMSCVAYMDSGYHDVKPSALKNAMAMSSGDSLYIAMRLACDPFEQPADYELKRVLGNVGRPGVTFLIPPLRPIRREVDVDSWKVINNASFNFRAEDHFSGTTIHLNFTGYHAPIVNEFRQGRDSEVFLLEAVVSVHEFGRWVGDLDIIKSFNHLNSPIMRLTGYNCNNPVEHSSFPESIQESGSELISAECWDEILDLPRGGFVVRANGNWIGRLAVTAMLSQILVGSDRPTKDIVVCPNNFCWRCNNFSHGAIFVF